MTDVEVTVDGFPFDAKAVSGISIQYGINMIPIALLTLDAPYIQQNYSAFICNPEPYKDRKNNPITIRIKSKLGCIVFDGFFDGLNISQSVGYFSYQAVVKSKFQRMTEVYPKMIGIMPSSYVQFTGLDQLTCNFDNVNGAVFTGMAVRNTIGSTDDVITEFLIKLIRTVVDTQLNLRVVTNVAPTHNPIQKIIESKNYIENLQAVAKLLLDSVNLKYVAKCRIKGSSCANNIAKLVLNDHTDLWDMLTRAYNIIGCHLVVANNQVYVVPEASFMQIDHGVPRDGEEAKYPNIANPVQYNSFSLNDVGYSNVGYCIVVANPSKISDRANQDPQLLTSYLGSYPKDGEEDPNIPTNGATGILIVNAPDFLMLGMNYGMLTSSKVHNDTAAGAPPFDKPVDDPKDVSTNTDKVVNSILTEFEKQKPIMDAYAKLKFLQAKNGERTGQISSIFNPKWVPGTSGSLYARLPGTFIQFFVTGVSHNISMSVPNAGVATTSISFSSARVGTEGNIAGAEDEPFFEYTIGAMYDLQKDWVSDISVG